MADGPRAAGEAAACGEPSFVLATPLADGARGAGAPPFVVATPVAEGARSGGAAGGAAPFVVATPVADGACGLAPEGTSDLDAQTYDSLS